MKNQKGVSLITLIITIIVVIILAVIVLRSGASDAPDQAAFSKFTQQMGELQDNVRLAMMTAKGEESLKGNQRTEAQLYNFVARGGYEAIPEGSGDKWLLQSDAKALPCTIINKEHAKKSLGADLPEIKVETHKGTNQEVSYFVTPEGTVFCWPPYVYDGKSYVNANVEDALDIEKVNATSGDITITLDNKSIRISNTNGTNAVDLATPRFEATVSGDNKPAVWYAGDDRTVHKDRGVAQGYTFNGYENDK